MIILLFAVGVASILYSIIYPKDFMPQQYIEEKPKDTSRNRIYTPRCG